MATPQARSVNAELAEGMTDGKYKKVVNDRGGVVEALTYVSRHQLFDTWHGIHETPDKVFPDARYRGTTPNFVATPPAQSSCC